MIKVFNIRNGFANNSSSTHSILFLDKPPTAEDDYEVDFGWDFFTVTSKKGILEYLNASLHSNFEYTVSKDYITAIANSWTIESKPGYVDHQSLLNFPLSFDRKGINKKYFDEIKNLLLSNNTMILGGNDNDTEKHPLYDKAKAKNFAIVYEGGKLISKYDESQKYWTLFNPVTGLKLRMVFDSSGERKIMPEKASTPDLVDIKITDYCNFGCTFCYQGSTENGKHADFNHIKSVINTLRHNEVFEIAFGGGEPTTHPKFMEILQHTKDNHIIPNFTTKDFGWLKNNIKAVQTIIGSCAYSINNWVMIKKIFALMELENIPKNKICVQYVIGTASYDTYKLIVQECCKYGINLTLLGFKTINRGVSYTQQDNSKWLEFLIESRKNNEYCVVGVDTALIEQYEEQLKDFPSWIYHKEEGAFSCYVDCVDHKMGKSSYHELEFYNKNKFHIEFLSNYEKY